MKVTKGMRWNWLAIGLVMFLVLILALAWSNGGKKPLREIVQPVAVPELQE